MPKSPNIILAVKSAPEEKIFSSIEKAGIEGVELYLSQNMLDDVSRVANICKKFQFKYAIHAPNDGYAPAKLLELQKKINAGIIIFHDIYWDDEWKEISDTFKDANVRLCVENVSCNLEPLKMVRRYNFGKCLDLEHIQMECSGVYEEVFINYIADASHVHLSGYVYGSKLWHTHIHHSPEHGLYMLDLLDNAGYSGFVVSEAKVSLQTYEEFKKLKDFFTKWESAKECGTLKQPI